MRGVARVMRCDSSILRAHFGPVARERSTPEARLRNYLLAVASLGAVLLFNSSSSCWGCINEVSLGETGGLFDVEAQLLLGPGWTTDGGKMGGAKGDKLQDDDQMAITLENLLHSVYAGQHVRSHVWLCPVDDPVVSDAVAWRVANFDECSSATPRSQWRRSQSVVSGVRIVEEPDERRLDRR
eukprot:Skav215945  [mRNA]  locus=scaffold226:699203:702368:+ [translate_table: standard]